MCISTCTYITLSAVCVCNNIGLMSLILLGWEIRVSCITVLYMCTSHPHLNCLLCHPYIPLTYLRMHWLRLLFCGFPRITMMMFIPSQCFISLPSFTFVSAAPSLYTQYYLLCTILASFDPPPNTTGSGHFPTISCLHDSL